MARIARTFAPPAVLLLALLSVAAPTAAHHKSAHGTSAVTEDNDSDGVPNNVADEGDNLHPSGKDRSVENGSGNQGNSGSTPDQNGKGPERDHNGTDKPGGTGGVDVFDQDGNNGCGNDDDFEDDNEGLCLGRTKTPPGKPAVQPSVVTPPGKVTPRVVTPAVTTPVSQVAGVVTQNPAPPPAAVLGVVQTRPGAVAGAAVQGGALAATGATLVPLAGMALLLLLTGVVLRRSGREGRAGR